MKTYIIRRLLLTIPSLFILTILVFSVVRLIPGDTVDAMVAQMETGNNFRAASGRDRETLERLMGLDVPAHMQYLRWIGVLPTPDWRGTGESEFKGLFQGTLGESLYGGGSTIDEIVGGRLPVTIELGVLAIVIGLLIALPVGVYSAIRQDTAADYVGRTVAVIGLATPNFWLATMALLYPALWWGWSPPMELIRFEEDPMGNLGMFLMPALILGTALAASTMRMTRTMMLEVLRQDYIRTAWSKGLRERVVVMRHAIKNAFIPVVTLIGLQLPILIGGSVILEQIFALPGLGRLFVRAIDSRDYPIVSAINLIFAAAVLAINLLIDMLYAFLDPRIRYQ